jgi:hypothetical protein
MPIYEFEDERSGEVREVLFKAMQGPDGPPSIGEKIPGTPFRRLPSGSFEVGVVRSFTFRAYSQPQGASGAPAYDSDRTPCFSSRGEIQRYVDHQNRLTEQGKSEQGGEIISYDACPGEEDIWARKERKHKPAHGPMPEAVVPTVEEIMRALK